MKLGASEVTLVPMALGIVTAVGHGVTHFRLFGFLNGRLTRKAWAECGDVAWSI